MSLRSVGVKPIQRVLPERTIVHFPDKFSSVLSGGAAILVRCMSSSECCSLELLQHSETPGLRMPQVRHDCLRSRQEVRRVVIVRYDRALVERFWMHCEAGSLIPRNS